MPDFVLNIRPPDGIILAADLQNDNNNNNTNSSDFSYELEGDLFALSLIDLNSFGLSEYASQILQYDKSAKKQDEQKNKRDQQQQQQHQQRAFSSATHQTKSILVSSSNFNNTIDSDSTTKRIAMSVISDIFAQVDNENQESLTLDEAGKLLEKLSAHLGRELHEQDLRTFFNHVTLNNDDRISLNDFKNAFEKLL